MTSLPLPRIFSNQPRAAFLVFFMEFWERFSYYGFLSILVLWLTAKPIHGGLGWTNAPALLLVGYVIGAVWIAPIVGGWIADRGVGARRAVVLGGCGLAVGNALLALAAFLPGILYEPAVLRVVGPLGTFSSGVGSDRLVLLSLSLGLVSMVVGAGLFKSNASALLSAQFGKHDPRRGPAFTLLYMGVNLGALAAPLGAGTLGESVGWGWGFAAAGLGMALGVTMFLTLAGRWLQQDTQAAQQLRQTIAPALAADRAGLWTVFGLVPFAAVFWSGMLQYSGLLNLFTAERVSRQAFGMTIPASWFLSVNPAVILVGGPLVASFWARLDARAGRDLFVIKVASALAAMSLAFALLFVGASGSSGIVSPFFLLGFWIIITLGELSLMPVGLALIGRIAPPRMVGMLMGVWLMTLGAGSVVAGWIGAWGERVGAVTAFGATALAGLSASLLLLGLSLLFGRRSRIAGSHA